MPDVLGPASLAASQSITAFQFFLPKLSDVRKVDASSNPEIVGDVRMGEVAAIALALGVGAITSSLSQSPVPMFAAVVMVAILVCVYEAALRGDRPWEPRTSNVERRTDDA